METEISNYWLTRFIFQRSLGFIYLIGFIIIINQYTTLVGNKGLLPTKDFTKRASFWDAPSIFWVNNSDFAFIFFGIIGFILAVLAISGQSDSHGIWFSMLVWGGLWLIYLSFVNFGQTFYSFGWEVLLLETGFLAIFLGSSDRSPPIIVIWLLRWVLFRLMFGAGLIKLRGDPCWRNLTCMDYHYQTQPVPNPLSWFFHRLPPWFHKIEVAFTHFVELIVPFGYFFPKLIGYAAGGITIIFQVMLILSGNLSWLNYITIVLCIPCFDDKFLSQFIPIEVPETTPLTTWQQGATGLLLIMVAYLSLKPIQNLFSKRQAMNRSYDSLHLVNTYGAFGSVTKVRNEVIIEGTSDEIVNEETKWREYEFKCKPGDISRKPCLMSPYHYRLDWQIWFAAMSTYHHHPWILNLAVKFLENDQKTLSLIRHNPFPEEPPKYIRATLYKYEFTTADERKETENWWKRTYLREYFPPIFLKEKE